jgi:AraC-like DNA-binding protein
VLEIYVILHIKNMVSGRCIISVKDTFGKLGLSYESVVLGEAKILSVISDMEMAELKKKLLISGFEILEDKKTILIEKIKTVILEMVHNEKGLPEKNISYFISSKLNYDYTYLANIFSEVIGSTIERFIIMHKIERVKELIQDGELTITDISYKMSYSSVAHLSGQFKKITGLTPTAFKKQENKVRNNLEDL